MHLFNPKERETFSDIEDAKVVYYLLQVYEMQPQIRRTVIVLRVLKTDSKTINKNKLVIGIETPLDILSIAF